MALAPLLNGLGRACKQHGPGRLPKADRREIGAGYAAATAALGTTLSLALGGLLTEVLPVPSYGRFATGALFALPFVVPAAFLSGALVWSALPDQLPLFGAIAGVTTTLCTYVVAAGGVAVVLVLTGGHGTTVATGLVTAANLGVVAFVRTVPLALPVGLGSGLVHESVVNGPTRCDVVGRLRAAGFWAAIVLPFVYTPILVIGIDESTDLLAFVGLLAVNVIAVLLGQGHTPQ